MLREQLPKFHVRLLMRSGWALVALAICLGAEARGADRTPTFRLRVEWAGESAALWRGRLAISPGQLDEPQSLGMARDDVGTIVIKHGTAAIRRRSPRSRDGFDISVTASAESRLEFEMGDERSDEPPLQFHLSLSECLVKPRFIPAEGTHPRIILRRAPGNALTVHFDRPHLVFDPDESFRLAVGFNPVDVHDAPDKPGKATLKWKLQPADGGKSVADGSTTLAAFTNSPQPVEVPIELRLPHEEGVYNLRLAVFGRGVDDVERYVQLIVIDPTPVKPPIGRGRSEKLVDSFERVSRAVSQSIARFVAAKA